MQKVFPILKNEKELLTCFERDNRFVLGIGGNFLRKTFSIKMRNLGGQLISVISNKSTISKFDVKLDSGVNLMHGVTIQPSVQVGEGSLINANSIIHHDCVIGNYCEIGSGVIITGKCIVDDFSFIGAGAILKPGIRIGQNAIIGAGAVVIENVAANTTVVGTPAKPLKK